MDLADALTIGAALQPYVKEFMNDVERSDLPGAAKRQKVLDLTGTVYEGARRLGKLDGVKELNGVDWSLLAPLIGTVVDGLVQLWNELGLWLSKRRAAAAGG